MPKKPSTRDFIANQLRFLIRWKKTSPAIRLRCIDRLAVIEKLYDVKMRDQEPEQGDNPEHIPVEVQDTVQKMLEAAANMARRDDGNKLSNSKPSGS